MITGQATNPKLAVVIATKNRSVELANRSLRSVCEQTRLPNYLAPLLMSCGPRISS